MTQDQFNIAVIKTLSAMGHMVKHVSSNELDSSVLRDALAELELYGPKALPVSIRIDNKLYECAPAVISGAQVRELAHIPETAALFLRRRMACDEEIFDGAMIDISDPTYMREFTSQAKTSTASTCHAPADHQAGEQ
jgi:hypothetical protein